MEFVVLCNLSLSGASGRETPQRDCGVAGTILIGCPAADALMLQICDAAPRILIWKAEINTMLRRLIKEA